MLRRSSAASTALAKQELCDALDGIRTRTADPQRVYSSLIAIHGVLVEHSHRDVLVDAVLSRADAVALLCELLHNYVAHEEIQWCLCRVLVLACSSSLRFQCQAGQLALWTDVYHVRSAHPASIRVLKASLELYEALLRGNEFHSIKARPAQSLIHEMLATIDRFSQRATSNSSSAFRTRTYEAWRPEMVIGATRVLAAIYASPRIQTLVEERNETFAHAIVTRLVKTFDMFGDCECDARLWLQLARLQIQQCHNVAVSELLLLPVLDSSAVAIADVHVPWFARLLDTWRETPAVVYDFTALLTLVFALPHEPQGHLDALKRALLLGQHSLLSSLSELLALYHTKFSGSAATTPSETQSHEHLALAIHEIVRALRMWSAEASTCTSFDAMSPRVSKLLVSTLTAQLQHCAAQIQQPAGSSSATSSYQQRALQHTLELLLVLQHLASSSHILVAPSTSKSKSSALGTQQPVPVLHALRQQLNSLAATRSNDSKQDTDLDALVRRELVKLEKTLRLMPPSTPATPQSLSSSASAAAATTVGSTSKRMPLLLPSPTAATRTQAMTMKTTVVKSQQPSSRSLTKAMALRSPPRIGSTAAVVLRTSASMTRL